MLTQENYIEETVEAVNQIQVASTETYLSFRGRTQ